MPLVFQIELKKNDVEVTEKWKFLMREIALRKGHS